MKNLFLLGSPRKDGNSETMAKAVASKLLQNPHNSVEFISLNTLTVRPCQACGGCFKKGLCVIKDDMQTLYRKTDDAQRIFFVSPIYFYALSAQLKCFIDRCQAKWARKYILNKSHRLKEHRTGHLISCAATKGDNLFTGATLTIQCLCDTLDLKYGEPLLFKNLEGPDALRQDSNKLSHCHSYAKNIITTTLPTP
jgi:multimeric flavodoxin WrbA